MMEVEYDNDNDNNNNDENIDHPQQVLEQEQQRQQAADADTAANDDDSNEEDDVDGDGADVDAVLLQLLSIVQQQKEFPFRTRNKIVALAEEYIENLKDDIHDMLCDQHPDAEHYQGLDINRDTVAEVETAVQFFPELLSRRADDDDDGDYPIQCLACTADTNRHFVCNWRAIPFIALLARLAIEFNQFEVEQRGGLLIEDEQGDNTLRYLVRSSHSSYNDNHQQLVENVCLTLMIQLKQIDLFKKEDIPQHQLVIELCANYYYFSENRMQFLIEWDPTSLLQPDAAGWLPLHWAARRCIRGFQAVFNLGVVYYPNKKGINLLFTKGEDSDICGTPFEYACINHGREVVMKAIEEILIRHNSVETPLNIVDTLLTAAIDNNVHIDGVYFLLRRQPDVLFKLLHDVRDGNNVLVDMSISGGGGGGGHNYDDDDANDDEKNGKHQDNNDDDDNDSNNDGDGDGDGKDENNDGNDEGNHEEGTNRNNSNKRKRAH